MIETYVSSRKSDSVWLSGAKEKAESARNRANTAMMYFAYFILFVPYSAPPGPRLGLCLFFVEIIINLFVFQYQIHILFRFRVWNDVEPYAVFGIFFV